MHFRKQIRARFVKQIKDFDIDQVGDNVHNYRMRGTEEKELPIVMVYTQNENSERFDEAPISHKRSLNVVVEVRYSGHDGDERTIDVLDDITNEVEKAILYDAFLGTKNGDDWVVEDTDIITTDYSQEDESESYVVSAAMTFLVTYISCDSRSSNSLEDLNTIHTNTAIVDRPEEEGAENIVDYTDA